MYNLSFLLAVICSCPQKAPPSLNLTTSTEDLFTNGLEKKIYFALRAAGEDAFGWITGSEKSK